MSKKVTRKQAINRLWELGNLEYLLKGKQKDIKKYLKENPDDISVILSSRRFGKCIAEGSEILTTKGLKNIEDIEIGDYVYGYNKDGTVTPTRVEQKHNQGVKEVWDYVNNGRVIETATKDHRWLVKTSRNDKTEVSEAKDFKADRKIVREFIKSPCGDVNFNEAYALGAFLGDGCSRQGKQSYHISGADEEVIKHVSDILDCGYYKQSKDNYTWCVGYNNKIAVGENTRLGLDKPYLQHYDSWCENKYAHEKIVDLEVVKTWDRETCLKFLAGLIDTDGSVCINKNILNIQFTSQSMSLVRSVQFLIHQLFQYKAKIHTDKRDKYVNGPVHLINIKNNLHSKVILKELTRYLQVPRKKWKEEYFKLNENNSRRDSVGVKLVNPRKMQTWDIGINNGTHLFLTGNGLVTHNSFVLCCWAIEECLRTPKAIVKYACPEKIMVETIITPIIKQITEDCPEHLKPEWKEAKKVWQFPNGSMIQIAGTDKGHIEKLRGGYAHLCICDEAGFMNDLDYVVNSVLAPTTDTTDGKIVLASTPNPKDPNHEFHVDFIIPLQAQDKLVKFTIFESPMVDEQKIQRIIDRYPQGVNDPKFRCEYLCEIAVDENVMVVPEFTSELERDIVREVSRPSFFDAYVSGDPAVTDLTGILFSYYDYMNTQLVILDETTMGGDSSSKLTTQEIADAIVRKEDMHFVETMTGLKIKPRKRIMDNNNKILMNDLYVEHQLEFTATAKDNKEAQINKLRMMIRQGKILIHPRCKQLIYHIKSAKWNKKKDGFDRVKSSKDGKFKGHHCDLLDALIYLVRNVDYNHNPYPDSYDGSFDTDIVTHHVKNKQKQVVDDFLKSIMNIRDKS